MDRSAIPTGLTPVYFYELDADDLIVAASDSWDTFAHENEGEHLVFEKIRGTVIWDHITDPETSELYRRIFASARAGRPVQFFLRCDSPTVRRMLSVHAAMSGDESKLRVSTMLFRADQREFHDIRGKLDTEKLISLPACSWCEKVMVAEQDWQEIEAAAAWLGKGMRSGKCRLSYTVCPSCRVQIERQLTLAGS